VVHDRHRRRREAVVNIGRELGGAVDMNVEDGSAEITDRVVVVGDVWVEAGWAVVDADLAKFAHRSEIGQCLVDGPKGDSWHLFGCRRVQRFCRWMLGVVVQQRKQQLALRGDFQSL